MEANNVSIDTSKYEIYTSLFPEEITQKVGKLRAQEVSEEVREQPIRDLASRVIEELTGEVSEDASKQLIEKLMDAACVRRNRPLERDWMANLLVGVTGKDADKLAVTDAITLGELIGKDFGTGSKKRTPTDRLVVALAEMVSTTVLGKNRIAGAAQAWKEREFKQFDCNPGDGQCQLRGYLVWLFSSDGEVAKEMTSLNEEVRGWNLAPRAKFKGYYAKTLTQSLTEVKVSKKVLYLLRCYFSASLLGQATTGPRAVEPDLIRFLSGSIKSAAKKSWQNMIDVVHRDLSKDSVELMINEAQKLNTVSRDLVLQMLAPIPTPDKYLANCFRGGKTVLEEKICEPKFVGCMFYEYVAILELLKESRGLVCFKDVGRQFCLFLRPRAVGEEFARDDDAPSDDPVVVFLGEVDLAAQKRLEAAFTEVILVCGALGRQYSTAPREVEDLEAEARNTITEYQNKESRNSPIRLYHVYPSTVKAELTTWNMS